MKNKYIFILSITVVCGMLLALFSEGLKSKTIFNQELDKKKNSDRFFAGIPKVPNKKKESMAIYLIFLQHIIFSLNPDGKAAVVVPTGFITAQSGIEKKIREFIKLYPTLIRKMKKYPHTDQKTNKIGALVINTL